MLKIQRDAIAFEVMGLQRTWGVNSTASPAVNDLSSM